MAKIKHTIWIPEGMTKEQKSKLSKELYKVVDEHHKKSFSSFYMKKNENYMKKRYGKNKK
jgi:hypothetical protein